MSATAVHRNRKPRPHKVVHPHGTDGGPQVPEALKSDIPDDARVGNDPQVLAILQDYTTNYAHEDRHIDGYAFGPNPSAGYSHFIKGAHVLCYYWDSSHAAQGEYTEMSGDWVLTMLHEGKTTWDPEVVTA